jgi:hypothetical protein
MLRRRIVFTKRQELNCYHLGEMQASKHYTICLIVIFYNFTKQFAFKSLRISRVELGHVTSMKLLLNCHTTQHYSFSKLLVKHVWTKES